MWIATTSDEVQIGERVRRPNSAREGRCVDIDDRFRIIVWYGPKEQTRDLATNVCVWRGDCLDNELRPGDWVVYHDDPELYLVLSVSVKGIYLDAVAHPAASADIVKVRLGETAAYRS
jgi:hypothetical protein